MGSSDENLLNKLVSCNDSIGTIRYVGPLEEGTDIWYGIEWYDPSRGKHDGTYKGKRYFSTKFPTGGSFVRPNKVDFGVDIWQAILDKYYDENEVKSLENTEDKDKDHFLYNSFNLIKQRIAISNINLANCRISSLNRIELLYDRFSTMKELDLESNLFHSWLQIFEILDKFKNLRIINISKNKLDNLRELDNETRSYPNIENLIMNRMNYDWNDVTKVIKHFPKINELKVCFNRISEIGEINESLINGLKILDLESNPISDWSQLCKLGILKELESLYINGVGLSNIFFDDCPLDGQTNYFPNLRSLAINDNKIDSWSSINALNQLKSLDELRFRFNPLNNSESKDNVRESILARMERLTLFNRTPIKLNDRKGAEIDYLKQFGRDWLEINEKKDIVTGEQFTEQQLTEKREKFLREHPRYASLVKIYGPAERSELKLQNIDTLKSKLISVNILNEETNEIIKKKLPLSLDISRLKLLVSKLFKDTKFKNLKKMELYYTNKEDPSIRYMLDNDYRTLDFYSIENDDTLIVSQY